MINGLNQNLVSFINFYKNNSKNGKKREQKGTKVNVRERSGNVRPGKL